VALLHKRQIDQNFIARKLSAKIVQMDTLTQSLASLNVHSRSSAQALQCQELVQRLPVTNLSQKHLLVPKQKSLQTADFRLFL